MLQNIYSEIANRLQNFPTQWDGKVSILKMRDGNSPHWRQMEWVGFYFQFLCEEYLDGLFQFQTPTYDKVFFDGFYTIPFDFKAHVANTRKVPLNDSEAMLSAIKEYGSIGIILALGEAEYDDVEKTFRRWHEEIKGELSEYVKEGEQINRKSRRRKQSFVLSKILIIEITDNTLEKCGSFQKGFRNS
ncbi:MAG: hypothetical protein FWE67_13625, partial [Planctomycetaceae bacterium]|nr:hypothetical protein [Planctomycetaceae bacterium]